MHGSNRNKSLWSYPETKFFCAAFLTPAWLLAQDLARIEVEDHRPLAAALDQLEVQIGAPIHYEDPPYESEADLQDVSTLEQRLEVPGYRLLAPRKEKVIAEFDPRLVRADPAGVVRGLIGSYDRSGLSGQFQVVQRPGGSLHVAPTRVRGESCKSKPVVSPLSAEVTIPLAERTVAETFVALLDEISKASGVRALPGNLLVMWERRISFSATRETARDALTRLLQLLWSSPVSYRLMYDPVLKDYMLNLQPVKRELTSENRPSAESSESAEAAQRFFDSAPE